MFLLLTVFCCTREENKQMWIKGCSYDLLKTKGKSWVTVNIEPCAKVWSRRQLHVQNPPLAPLNLLNWVQSGHFCLVLPDRLSQTHHQPHSRLCKVFFKFTPSPGKVMLSRCLVSQSVRANSLVLQSLPRIRSQTVLLWLKTVCFCYAGVGSTSE